MTANRNTDKFRGCLIGGAAGDALGYAVEFLSEKAIEKKYGPDGILGYDLRDNVARISDDTQMTMFTANGILLSTHQPELLCTQAIAIAYREWYKTQFSRYSPDTRFNRCWLMDVPELYSPRAPGNTCLSAIEDGCCGTIDSPPNNSKGCGGVMRVAPLGLFFEDTREAALLAAEAAALTHGHEMGYIPAALLATIVNMAVYSAGKTLKEIVLESLDLMDALFPDAETLPAFRRQIELAVSLAETEPNNLVAIHKLGPGWCGDDAIAVAIYCALKYQNDFDMAMIASVNHGGDSDSTGAITGNILGAWLGLAGIPEKYLAGLELKDVLLELADDLCAGERLEETRKARYRFA